MRRVVLASVLALLPAAMLAQEGQMFLGLDAFSSGPDADLDAQIDDRLDRSGKSCVVVDDVTTALCETRNIFRLERVEISHSAEAVHFLVRHTDVIETAAEEFHAIPKR